MSIPVSSAPAAKAAIVAAIKADATIAADPTIAVCYAPPGPAEEEHDDWIAVGGYRRQATGLAMVGSGGAGWLEENYTIEVVVSVFRGTDEQQIADERCAALVARVESAVRSDPSLGGVVTEAYPESDDSEPSWEPEGRGRFAVSTMQIRCTNASY